MKLIKAEIQHIDEILEIIKSAILHLKEQGIDQWQDGYPNRESIENDIANKKGYILTNSEDILGYTFIDFDKEPCYDVIDGAWATFDNSIVLHRIAISDKHRGKKLSSHLFSLACEVGRKNGVNSVRVDTHKDNKKMQHVLAKNGFTYRGKVVVNGKNRMGFDKSF